MWDNVVNLIVVTKTVDDAGDIVEQETTTTIFCNELSVGQSEYYQAMANGFKPEIKLKIHRLEYNNQKKAEYNGIKYDVIRTYANDNETVELVLGGGVNATAH